MGFGAISLFRAPRRPWVRAAAWSQLAVMPVLFLAATMLDIRLAITVVLVPMLYVTALARLS